MVDLDEAYNLICALYENSEKIAHKYRLTFVDFFSQPFSSVITVYNIPDLKLGLPISPIFEPNIILLGKPGRTPDLNNHLIKRNLTRSNLYHNDG